MPSTPSSSPRSLVAGAVVLVAVAAVSAVLVLSGGSDERDLARCGQPLRNLRSRALQLRDEVPDFRLPSLDGQCFDLADFHGRPLVVNFWASWCNPCREEFPLLREARAEHEDQELVILGVDHDDIASDARRFVRDQEADWELVFDEDDVIAELFGVRPIPQTFFVGRDGSIVSRIYGFTSKRELEAELEKILQT